MKLLSNEAAAKMLARNPRTLANWRSSGRGPRYVRSEGGQFVGYRQDDIERWIEEMTVSPDIPVGQSEITYRGTRNPGAQR